MKTPIASFLREYSTRGGTRLHMPGHKGRGFSPEISHDITEVSGADVLYTPEGIILESEKLRLHFMARHARFIRLRAQAFL